MNRRKIFKNLSVYPQIGLLALVICSVLFAAGCIAGVFFSGAVESGDPAVNLLQQYLSETVSGENTAPEYIQLLFSLSKYQIIAFLCGFSLLGVLAVPLLTMFRGFALSFSIALFIRVYGSGGTLLAFLLLGVCALISVPCFFIISVQSFCASIRLYSAAVHPDGNIRAGIYNREYFLRFLVCVALLLLISLAEKFILLHLVSALGDSI